VDIHPGASLIVRSRARGLLMEWDDWGTLHDDPASGDD
jgi:hypothetical protein